MSEITKKQHYVPQFYLKRFSDKDGYLYIYNKLNGEIFKSLPENICQKNYLYETKWENANEKLGKYVLQNSIEISHSKKEAEYADLLAKLLRRCNPLQRKNALICQSKEKILLAEFAVNLYVRHPWTMRAFQLYRMPSDIEDADDRSILQAGQEIFSRLGLGSIDSLVIDIRKKIFMTNEFENSFCGELTKRLCSVDLTFFYSSDAAFITSSFPSGLVEDMSAATEEKLTSFLPLSPEIAVIFGNFEGMHKFRNRIVALNRKAVMEFNYKHMNFSKKRVQFVISHSESLLKELIQPN